MTLLLAWNFDEASGPVLDHSGNGRTWTPGNTNGNTARTPSGHTNGGITQNFADSQGLGPSLTGLQTADRTVMAWIYQTASIIGWILEFHISSISSGGWGILFLNNQYNIQARHDTSSLVRAAAAEPSKNAWHHVAGTYDGSNVRLYIDGTLAATAALAGGLYSGADFFRVMDQSGAETIWDDARLFDTALSQSEIQTYMNTPVVAPASSNVYFSDGSQPSGVYEMTAGGVLVQRNSLITIK